MKSKILLACILLSLVGSAQQGALLVPDSSSIRYDTVHAKMVYIDTIITKPPLRVFKTSIVALLLRDDAAYAVRKIARMMYKGINGAPNAPTGQESVLSILYYTGDNKTVGEDWIVKFIIQQPKK
jgi:hypothetical protein